ncbi:hypothetical protein SNOG_16025 [Parastagonospora nodorum SN15]|uniref:Uncharacterized protein n=1 Tax=Phaeosphaeria nodorum (strain SN15 / ATCC MYA-4574 / FGSC 10173) TaxID=321614 RepID=Q0TWU9_PHANO|nr:hypothetical protein SNOG_16025 [Parastagonospora nodorum SN15]EAT76604.1 hypothetical protein SNOG_16025 [Parastagonospora nodorum SN15]
MAIAFERLFPAEWASWEGGYATSQQDYQAMSKLPNDVFPVHDSDGRIRKPAQQDSCTYVEQWLSKASTAHMSLPYHSERL